MEKKLIEEYFKLFYHNQNNIYFGSYGTTFDPFETPEGKLKYKSKIGKNPQTRLINKEFSLEDVLTHLLYNKDSFHCDENGIGNHENFVSYGKPVAYPKSNFICFNLVASPLPQKLTVCMKLISPSLKTYSMKECIALH